MVSLTALTIETLPQFRNLLGSKEFGGCFCAVWRSHGEDWESRCRDLSQPNFFITEKSIRDGCHVGYLVYEDQKLIGWTVSGPKTAFPFLKTKLGSRLSEFTDTAWSVGCIALSESARGENLSEHIVNAVIKEAKVHHAKSLEAYPSRPWDEPRSYRGSHKLYERMGFTEIASEKDGPTDIVLMRMLLC